MTAELNLQLKRYLPPIEAGEASNKIEAMSFRLTFSVSRVKNENRGNLSGRERMRLFKVPGMLHANFPWMVICLNSEMGIDERVSFTFC
jgi:hypothetical protein